KFENANRIIFSAGFVRMRISTHLAEHTLNGRLVQEPMAKGDAMAPHVHQHAAAGLLHIPEPGSMRSEMFLTLFHQVNFSKSALISHLLGLDVLWSKEQLLGIHQEHPLPLADVDHLVCLFQRHAQGLFTDNMLSGPGDLCSHRAMEAV